MRVVKVKKGWVSVPTPPDFEKYSYNTKTGQFSNDTKGRVLDEREGWFLFMILAQEGYITLYENSRGEEKWAFTSI